MKEFIDHTPFFRLFFWLALGVVLRQYIPSQCTGISILLALSILLVLQALFYRRLALRGWRNLFGFLLALWLLALGWALTSYQYRQYRPLNEHQPEVQIVVVDRFPIPRKNSSLIHASLISTSSTLPHVTSTSKVMLYLKNDSAVAKLTPGDQILIYGMLQLPSRQPGVDAFSYGNYLYQLGVMGTAYIQAGHWTLIGRDSRFSLKWMGEKWRHFLVKRLQSMELDANVRSIMVAMALGYREELAPDVKQMFLHTGASHVLAVSGLHVGIIFLAFFGAFSFLNKWKWGQWLRLLVTLGALWLYALITGLTPSVSRAAFMYSCLAIAITLERNYFNYNALFCSAFFIVLFNPLVLFQVSFLLSYTAVFSILFFYPRLSSLLTSRFKWINTLWKLLIVSLAAQIGTSPFVLYYFHQFPLYGLISNFVVIPLATIILYGTFLLLLLGSISFLSSVLVLVMNGVVTFEQYILQHIAQWPGAIKMVWIDHWQLLLLFLLLAAFMALFIARSYKTVVSFLSLLLVTLCSFSIKYYYIKHNDQHVVVYGDVARLYGNGKNWAWYLSKDKTDRYDQILMARYALPVTQWGSDTTIQGFQSKGINYLLLQNNPFYYKCCSSPLAVDVLVIGDGVYPNERLFQCFITPKWVILTQDVKIGYIPVYQKLGAKYNFKVHPIRTKGTWSDRLLTIADQGIGE